VFIPGVTSDMMSLIIDYAYTRETVVTSENVERLLPAADQFHVLGLVKRCCDFLASGLDVDNCIGIRNFARNYFCSNLERIANRYASF
jgi:kelch-like protein 10